MNYPFLMRPTGKDNLWGGDRLNTDYHKNIPLSPLAETWEASVHPDGPSFVASGKEEGKTLKEALDAHPDYLGQAKEFPILIKFIDAKTDLSVQVHPSDEYAQKYENGEKGKTEMWFVLDAKPGAKIVYGLKQNYSKEEVRKAIEEGKLESLLYYADAHKGDVFFVRSGTIHAICGGVLIAEIQQSSNLTYRMYDYNRVGKDGKKRPLHIEKALDVATLGPAQPYISEDPSVLASCSYFTTRKMPVHGKFAFENQASYHVFLCLEGNGKIISEDQTTLTFKKGDCLFVPASSGKLLIDGEADCLDIQ